eukprot:TRINITY_DN9990_c0_g1_i3.p1 TRINITY_DN9990_c0_g1~~TRINITY_DN9990_c0_g1_i3.p1  ORF type:complete len:120 (+),score=22.69 TRINITY_DN9990_c0_g1_i3:125-484(+)
MEHSFQSSIKSLHQKGSARHIKALTFLLHFLLNSSPAKEPTKFSKGDLRQLENLLNEGENKVVRVLAAKVLCKITHKNPNYQKLVCELFDFTNFQGKVFIITSFIGSIEQDARATETTA